MNRQRSRLFILVLVAFALGAAGLLVPEPAAAAKRLFRVQRSSLGYPIPPAREHTKNASGNKWVPVYTTSAGTMTIPLTGPYADYGGAGRGENKVEPFDGLPSTALVTLSNKKGAPFTLPKSFIDYHTTRTYFSSTAVLGYTSFTRFAYVNGRGKFQPQNPNGALGYTRVVFETEGGNPPPNYGQPGVPVTPTATFSGDYGMSRAGSIKIDPGPNRFGGTMRILYPVQIEPYSFYQYIAKYPPRRYKAYGSFACFIGGFPKGSPCTEDKPSTVGQITSSGMVTRSQLMNAPVFTDLDGTSMIGMRTIYRKKFDPPQSTKVYYLATIAPWTTGKVKVQNPLFTYSGVSPEVKGYDKEVASADVTVTRTSTTVKYVTPMLYYSYMTTMEKLEGVTRIASLVRPRLRHTYGRNQAGQVIIPYNAFGVDRMKVFFLPEPGALLLIGSGIAGLAGLFLLRRR